MKLKVIECRPSIKPLVDKNGGYCPCAILRNPDTLCMCKEFREQDTPGECYCGRFKKVEVDNEP